MFNRVHFPRFSDQEYQNRWRPIRQAMEARQLDCLLIYGASCSFARNPGEANLRYVTNFADQFQACCVLPLKGDPTLITSFNGHIASAPEIANLEDIRFGGIRIDERVVEALQEKGMGKARIGIVGVNSVRRAIKSGSTEKEV